MSLYKFVTHVTGCTGCVSKGKSILLGAGVGAASGAAIGNGMRRGSRREKSTKNGALFGSVIGGLVGYLASTKLSKKAKSGAGGQVVKDEKPLLTKPKVKRVWVKDQVKGKRFVQGHWEYVIQENSVWSL